MVCLAVGRVSSVYVLPVEHTYVGCFDDKKGDRDLLLVPKVCKAERQCPSTKALSDYHQRRLAALPPHPYLKPPFTAIETYMASSQGEQPRAPLQGDGHRR